MLRTDWKFTYPLAQVVEAAKKRADYHAERQNDWEKSREEVMHEIDERGLEIRARDVTGGQRHELVLDPELSKRLNECETKMQKHEAKADEFAGWYEVLSAQEDRMAELTLDHDDVLYFGLH